MVREKYQSHFKLGCLSRLDGEAAHSVEGQGDISKASNSASAPVGTGVTQCDNIRRSRSFVLQMRSFKFAVL